MPKLHPDLIDPIPAGASLAQVLFYGPEKRLYVFFLRRKFYVRDEEGRFPYDLAWKKRHPHPDEGRECADASYETLGLYYNLDMPETGWSSNGEY